MLGLLLLWPTQLFLLPRIAGFTASPGFMYDYEGQHIYLQKILFTSVEILVTFEWTFSQLSHYGRTWVEMNKNTRKIGAWLQPNSPSP